jgi:hypothetical protein
MQVTFVENGVTQGTYSVGLVDATSPLSKDQ